MPDHGARADIQDDIVEVLERSGRFAAPARRQELIEQLAQRRGAPLIVPPVPHERTHLLFIVRECTRVECLTDLLTVIDTELGEWAIWRLRQLIDEWEGIVHFPDPLWLTI